MKLLIVDDQVIVTEGLRRGVNWAKIGFDEVETASSVSAARQKLQIAPADVLFKRPFSRVIECAGFRALLRSSGRQFSEYLTVRIPANLQHCNPEPRKFCPGVPS